MLADGGELALQLSRNELIRHFAEDEKEGLVMYVRTYMSKLGPDGVLSPAGKDWLRTLGGEAKSAIAQIMNHTETQRYLLNLEELRPHFAYQTIYSTTWVKANLHNVSGGVSPLSISLYTFITIEQ